MPRFVNPKSAEIARLWLTGITRREIAAQVELPERKVGLIINGMRRDGVDLPRRPTGRRPKNTTVSGMVSDP